MPIINKCNECGNIIPEDLIAYLEKGNQVFCERCGTPFSLKSRKLNKKEIKEDNLISGENKLKAQKILIGITFMNVFLVCYFFFIHKFELNFSGFIIFIFILFLGILEITRGFKLFKKKEYKSQILMVNTIGQKLLRKVLYLPSLEMRIKSEENEIKALKILIAFMYVNFIFVTTYYAATFYLIKNELSNMFYFLIYNIVGFFYLSSSIIILLKVKKLRYRFLKVSIIIQLIFYNSIIFFLFLYNPEVNFILIFLLDASILYLTIKIIKNKYVLMQYLPPKNHICQNCGSKMKERGKLCPKCMALLFERESGLEKGTAKKVEQRFPSDKKYPEPEMIVKKIPEQEETVDKRFEPEVNIKKKTEPEENAEGSGLELLEELSFLKEEKDKKLLEKYLLERFIVVSEQTRNAINNLNLSREEKIDLLKDFAFLSIKEQQNLLDLLVYLTND